jgi:hypothetical protein
MTASVSLSDTSQTMQGDDVTLDREIRQVLAELELISHGATVRFDPSTSHGHAGSRIPTGELSPPHLLFRARFDGCRTDQDREKALEAAQVELRSLKCRTMPVVGVDGAELLRRQILEDFVGVQATDVAIALYCTTSKVRNIRTGEGFHPDTGLVLVDFSENDAERARRYAAEGMTERQIVRLVGVPRSSLRRMLDRAA